jgi:hypothetical protein
MVTADALIHALGNLLAGLPATNRGVELSQESNTPGLATWERPFPALETGVEGPLRCGVSSRSGIRRGLGGVLVGVAQRMVGRGDAAVAESMRPKVYSATRNIVAPQGKTKAGPTRSRADCEAPQR